MTTQSDDIKLLKSAVVADMQAFGEFVEGVRQWGRAERVKLGLG